MTLSLGWYSQLLLLIFLCFLFFVLMFVFRKRWDSPPSRLRTLLRNPLEDPADSGLEQLVPLLLLEEEYRSFTDILGLVLGKYPIRRFRRSRSFSEALDYLCRVVYSDLENPALVSAMCQVVNCFLEDSDVEYSCRPDLQLLVDRFLSEAEQGKRESPGGWGRQAAKPEPIRV